MTRIKLLLVSAAFALALAVPMLKVGTASAFEGDAQLVCPYVNGEFPAINTDDCDLAITKQVSVNGGEFVDADAAATAATAHIGDTITWKIRVTNNSGLRPNTVAQLIPNGIVLVEDVLPSNVSLGDVTASVGAYSSNIWTFPLIGEGTTLPATLTITTTAATSGLVENNANLNGYICPSEECVDPPYIDANSSNNSNSAFVNISAGPQVLAESTTATPQVLAATGTGTIASVFAASLLGATLVIAGYGRVYKKAKVYRLSGRD